jgi:GNAT superfamily N-acetyltransferase
VKTTIELSADVPKTARVLQMAGLFDMPVDQRNTVQWTHELPIERQSWHVGLIVGPSGAGKTVLAKDLWPDRVRRRFDWPRESAILDAFPEGMGIRDITGLLTSVGLGSVPAWVRPYSTLSNGEQFRADVARAIASDADPVIIDEFTSVVDRQVAQVASHTIQKAIRRSARQFVAVTCHYDVVDWLQPDWIYDVAAQSFEWRSVQPHPPVRLAIHSATTRDWHLFARHHYMNHTILASAKCFVAYVDETPVAFTSYRTFPHPKTRNLKMGHRTVVLPDWQGLGISGRLAEWVGQSLWDKGFRYRRVIAHPAVIAYCERSPRWQEIKSSQHHLAVGPKASSSLVRASLDTRRLFVRSFQYRAPKERQ